MKRYIKQKSNIDIDKIIKIALVEAKKIQFIKKLICLLYYLLNYSPEMSLIHSL